jgi:hypothetical protein
MTQQIDTNEALLILEGRGMKMSRALFRHYCNTGRAPAGMVKVGRNMLFSPDAVAEWNPEHKQKGRKKK